MKKLLFTLLLIGAMSVSAHAQSDKIKEKAAEKTEELNAQIIAGDPSVALSDEQKEQLTAIYTEMLTAMKKVRKNDGDQEEMKAARKEYNKRIFGEVLTKEQRKARRAGKDE